MSIVQKVLLAAALAVGAANGAYAADSSVDFPRPLPPAPPQAEAWVRPYVLPNGGGGAVGGYNHPNGNGAGGEVSVGPKGSASGSAFYRRSF